MLGHVRDDMGKLKERVAQETGRPGAIDATLWLDELSHTYTVPEQHVVHRGGVPQAAGTSEITFF